jgi:hypothetical protein
MKFLNSWTIALDKLPAYVCFKSKFNITLDYALMTSMYKSRDIEQYEINDRKLALKSLLDVMKGDELEVKYAPRYGIGRFYPENSISPICISRHMKHTIFHALDWSDLDMVAGHATILYEIAKLNKRENEFPSVKNYIDNKPTILKELREYYTADDNTLTDDNVKDIFNIAIYGGGHSTWLNQMEKEDILLKTTTPHPIVIEFLKECKKFMDIIYINNPDIVTRIKGNLDEDTQLHQLKSRTTSYWCGTIENHIIHTVYKYLEKRGVINKSDVLLEYDGLCLKLNDNSQKDALVYDINSLILKETKLNVKMKFKDYRDEHIHLDKLNSINESSVEHEVLTEPIPCEADKSFESIKVNFELTHCKIKNKAFFIREFENRVIIFNKDKFTTAYEDLQFFEPVYNKVQKTTELVKKQFIGEWYKSDSKRVYDDVGIFPTGKTCPSNYFNMWKPFDMELVTKWEQRDDAVEIFKNHLLILCGNDTAVCDYLIKWIAQMVQYPAVKSICPVLISKEGAGKGTLLQLFSKMFGTRKVFETTQPSRDVWGEFNGLMAEAFLVNLNELSKKETLESEGKIKGLITDSTIKINNKGVAQYDVESFHHFIVTTNSENPMSTSKDDRRKLIIRSSDELIGNKKYFNIMYDLLADVNVVKSCYEYFKAIPEIDKFGSLPIPETEYQNDLKEMNISPIESWLKGFVLDNYYATEPIKLFGKEQYELFNAWREKCGMEYSCTIQAFGLRLKNLKINGITKGPHSNKGESKLFDIPLMRSHFDLNNIEIETD